MTLMKREDHSPWKMKPLACCQHDHGRPIQQCSRQTFGLETLKTFLLALILVIR